MKNLKEFWRRRKVWHRYFRMSGLYRYVILNTLKVCAAIAILGMGFIIFRHRPGGLESLLDVIIHKSTNSLVLLAPLLCVCSDSIWTYINNPVMKHAA